MPGKIVTYFRLLLTHKVTKQRQNIALLDVQREMGTDWLMLSSWKNDQLICHDGLEVETLCGYFFIHPINYKGPSQNCFIIPKQYWVRALN